MLLPEKAENLSPAQNIGIGGESIVGKCQGFRSNLGGIWGSLFESLGFPYSSVGKESPCSVGDLGSMPGWEDSLEKG